jgi:Raf kinase inhibitor-like YbhB/YbcL family protein
MLRRSMLALAIVFALAACGGDDDDASDTTTSSPGGTTAKPVDFQLRSPAFADGQPIPVRFTCDGENVSPPLVWAGAPADSEQLALIVNDPDAGTAGFVHWVLWAIPPENGAVEAGDFPLQAIEGSHDGGVEGYTGPCPPSGVHHYEFQLYALSEQPQVVPGAEEDQLVAAMADITLASTTLTGTYERAN